MYLSRLTLRRAPEVSALRELIDPVDRRGAQAGGRVADAHHRLLWSVFADSAERERDFLWRAEEKRRFFVLSARKPKGSPLFEPPETKSFDVSLAAGDRLRFTLRANAVSSLPGKPLGNGKHTRGRKVDVAMKVLHGVPSRDESNPAARAPGSTQEPSERAKVRDQIAREQAFAWLVRQGAAHGFTPHENAFGPVGYRTVTLPHYRGKRKGEPRFGVFDLTGDLTVRESDAFLAAVANGFGRAKAFGCGLMLIRRART